MARRVEHVADIEGRLAERQLEDDRRRGKLRDGVVDRRRAAPRRDGRRQRREISLTILGRVLVDRNRNRDRLAEDERARRDGGKASAAAQPCDRERGERRERKRHDRREARRDAKAVETRDVRIEERVDVAARDGPAARVNVRPERHRDGEERGKGEEAGRRRQPRADRRARSRRDAAQHQGADRADGERAREARDLDAWQPDRKPEQERDHDREPQRARDLQGDAFAAVSRPEGVRYRRPRPVAGVSGPEGLRYRRPRRVGISVAQPFRAAVAAPRADDRQDCDRQARKQHAFRVRPRLRDLSPQPQVGVGGEVRVDVGREAARFVERARVETEAAELDVRQEERRGDRGDGGARDRHMSEDAPLPPRAGPPELPHDVGERDRAEKEQIVAARQVLQRPRRRAAGERRHAARDDVAPESEEHERHPRGRQHLHVRNRRDAVRRERERKAGDERGAVVSSELAREREHRDRREDERREEDDVVAEDRIPGRGVHRPDLQRLRQQVLRVGERERMRREDVRAPPAAPEVRRVPREHPRAEQRIAQVAGHVGAEPPTERPGQGERGRDIDGGRRQGHEGSASADGGHRECHRGGHRGRPSGRAECGCRG